MIKARKISHFIASLLIAIVLPFGLSAQDDRLSMSWCDDNRHGVSIDFRVNSSAIDESYRDNATFLVRVDSISKIIKDNPNLEIVSLEICGSASPEGPAAFNRRLSNARMMALDSYLRKHIEIPDSVIVYNDQYIAWEYLAQLLAEDAEPVVLKDEVLAIIEQGDIGGYDSRGRKQDGRINAIQALDNCATWDLLNELYFDQMRNAWFIIVVVCHAESELAVVPVVEPAPEPITGLVVEPESVVETICEPEQVVEPEPELEQVVEPTEEPVDEVVEEPVAEPIVESVSESQIFMMSVKSNALEVAALIANLGVEFRLSPRLSLDVLGHYSPYNYFNQARKIRLFAIQPEVRYWWGEALVRGHFVGLHVPVAGFNIQLNDRYRFQDPNRAMWGVGVSYGYAMPLGDSGKWGVEFTVGVGYMNIKYDVYEGVHNGKYVRSGTNNYFGPTRLGVDFSYRIEAQRKNRDVKTIGE